MNCMSVLFVEAEKRTAEIAEFVEAAVKRQAQRGALFNEQCALADTSISDADMAVFVDYFLVKQKGRGNVCDAMRMLTSKYPNIPMNKAIEKRFIVARAIVCKI